VYDWIVCRSSLFRMQELVEALVDAGKFAGTLGVDQIDALHPSGDLLIVAAIAAQTHQVFGELKADRQRLLRATSANGPGGLLEFLHGYLARRKFFQNLRDALGFVPKDKRLLQLLKVNGRAIFGRDFAQFVAREDMEEQVAFLEPVNPLLKKMGADFRGGSRIFIRTCAGVEQAPGVCGLVQIIAQPALKFRVQKIHALLCGCDLRRQFFQILFERSGLAAKVIHLAVRAGIVSRLALEDGREQIAAFTRAASGFLVLFLNEREFSMQKARLFDQALVQLPGFGKLFGRVSGIVTGENAFADDIEKQRVKDFEAIRIIDEITEQHVMFEKEILVVAAFDEKEAVLQQRIHL